MAIRLTLVLIAYLAGSIPFGYLLVKFVFTSGEDVRRVGSGGTGATNVTRRAGKAAGLLTLLLDLAKGLLVVLLMKQVAPDDYLWIGATGVAVMIGHIFPLFLRFRGGKGVATGLGVFLAVAPYSVLGALAIWAIVVFLTRYVSLGSIAAAATLPLWTWIFYGLIQPGPDVWNRFIITLICGALVIAKHHENINRLIHGKESRFGFGSGSAKQTESSNRAVSGETGR